MSAPTWTGVEEINNFLLINASGDFLLINADNDKLIISTAAEENVPIWTDVIRPS